VVLALAPSTERELADQQADGEPDAGKDRYAPTATRAARRSALVAARLVDSVRCTTRVSSTSPASPPTRPNAVAVGTSGSNIDQIKS
jgi:hypothetical protein